jgi:hypothetical protein
MDADGVIRLATATKAADPGIREDEHIFAVLCDTYESFELEVPDDASLLRVAIKEGGNPARRIVRIELVDGKADRHVDFAANPDICRKLASLLRGIAAFCEASNKAERLEKLAKAKYAPTLGD